MKPEHIVAIAFWSVMIGTLVFLFRGGKKNVRVLLLDQVLLWWAPRDPFRVRDLLNGGVLILGRAGSGKTSSSGTTIGRAIVSNARSGGLILAAKPDDAEMWTRIFEQAGRELIVFDAQGPYRCNFLDYVGQGQTRNVVQCLTMIGETLRKGDAKSGGEDGAFWEAQCERRLYNAVSALQAAKEPISADRIHQFIMTAASNPAEMASPQWQSKYHSRVLAKGFDTKKLERQSLLK
jgi:hypothetical protein